MTTPTPLQTAEPITREFPGVIMEVYGTPNAPYRTWDELIAAAIPGMARLLMEPSKEKPQENAA